MSFTVFTVCAPQASTFRKTKQQNIDQGRVSGRVTVATIGLAKTIAITTGHSTIGSRVRAAIAYGPLRSHNQRVDYFTAQNGSANMQFTLASLLSAFVLIALSLAVFGPWGVVAGPILVAVVAYCRNAESRWLALTRVTLIVFGPGLMLGVPYVIWRMGVSTHPMYEICAENLRELHFGLLHYMSVNGKLPPPQRVRSHGEPPCSWRVSLLPYIGHEKLFMHYRRDEPWNGPTNGELACQMPRQFSCPVDPDASRRKTTSYVAVLDKDGDWLYSKSAETLQEEQRSLNPVLMIETYGSQIPWLEPQDVLLDELCKLLAEPTVSAAYGRHLRPGGFLFYNQLGTHVVFADGCVRFVPVGVPMDILRAALLGDPVMQDKLQSYSARRWNWPNCAALASLIACFVLMVAWPGRRTTST